MSEHQISFDEFIADPKAAYDRMKAGDKVIVTDGGENRMVLYPGTIADYGETPATKETVLK